jgi:hypothetical protein
LKTYFLTWHFGSGIILFISVGERRLLYHINQKE